MQISQIQAAADAIQDRLLLRIATNTHEEIRVFVTRRFLRELWPHLVTMLFDHLGANAPAAAAAEASPGSFSEPYRNDNPTLPLGATPLLPGEAKLEPAGPGQCKLTFREPQERSITLALNADLLQALCAMLRAAAAQAQWDLDLPYGSPAPVVAEVAATAKKRLH